MTSLQPAQVVCMLVISLGLGVAPATANLVVAYFEGVIDHADPALGLDGSVAPGTPFSGTYGFDPEIVVDDNPNDPRVGSYIFGTSFTLTTEVGNYELQSTDLGILILNDVTGIDNYQVSSLASFTSGGVYWTSMRLVLQDLTATALDSDVLTEALPDVGDFGFSGVVWQTTAHGPYMSGVVARLIPEPGAIGFLTIGALVVARRRHKPVARRARQPGLHARWANAFLLRYCWLSVLDKRSGPSRTTNPPRPVPSRTTLWSSCRSPGPAGAWT